MGQFVILGQFVARKMPVKQCFFMSASVGHFVAGEKVGHFVAGSNCRMVRKWDILCLGQFVARKMPLGQFVVGTKCLLTGECLVGERLTILLDNQVFTKLLVQSLYKKFKMGVKTKIFPHE